MDLDPHGCASFSESGSLVIKYLFYSQENPGPERECSMRFLNLFFPELCFFLSFSETAPLIGSFFTVGPETPMLEKLSGWAAQHPKEKAIGLGTVTVL